MKRIFFGVIVALLSCSSIAQQEPPLRTDVVTKYPDFNADKELLIDSRTQIKLGYPDSNGASVWAKGSGQFDRVKLLNANGGVVEDSSLMPPHYVHLFRGLDVDSQYHVEFLSADSSIIEKITTNSLDTLHNAKGNFSIAFYGCFQPYTVNEATYESALFNTGNDFPKRFLRTFSNSILGTGSDEVNALLPNTKLLVGTGDQVYMDAGYETVDADGVIPHPISAWTTTQFQSQLLRTNEGFTDHVEKTYRAFGAFKDLNEVQKRVSQVNAWDDHEIRDGWGSQEDEYESDNVTLSEKFKPAFMAAKKGFIDHQFLIGPRSSEAGSLQNNLKTMEQTFQVGSYKGIALDLRTQRNYLDKRVLGDDQVKFFKNWLSKEVKTGEAIIIVSTMPLFLRNYEFTERAANKYELDTKDDLNDGWDAKDNQSKRDDILSLLLEARIKRDIKPIFVSGDYHKGAISEIWYKDGVCDKETEKAKKVFGYELIASGLYHEGIVDNYSAFAFDKIESQRLGQHMIKLNHADQEYCMDPFVNMSIVRENFGGLEVKAGELDSLKLVVGNGKYNSADVFELPLDWDKPFDPKKEKSYNGVFQTMSRLFGWLTGGDTFTPRLPEHHSLALDEL